MLGFDTTCGDSCDRGTKFAERLNAGWSIRDAGTRACTETEGSGTNWAYLPCRRRRHGHLQRSVTRQGVRQRGPRQSDNALYLRGAC